MHTAQSLQAQNLKGLQAFQAKDYQKAADIFSDVLKHDPNNFKALAGIANILHNIGHSHKALEYTQKALAIEPRNVFLLSFASTIALEVGMVEEAKNYSKKAYKIDPKSTEGIKTYLTILQLFQDTPKIQKLTQQLLNSKDKSATTYNHVGMALESINKAPEAIRAFRNGITKMLLTKNPPPPRTTKHSGGR